MPSGYCPSCGATYDSPRISPNGPFCRYCLARGEVVQLLPATRQRFRRARTPVEERVDRATSRRESGARPRA
jgi:hypothetical protein